jgi:hypothetical protein
MPVNPLMNPDAMSEEERSYLLGLYLADGWVSKSSKGSYIVTFALQGNERAVVERVIGLMKRADLKPRVGRWFENCILVYACCRNLYDFFPDKERLLCDETERRKFFEDNNLLNRLDNHVAFCAGLLDGDGWCKAYVERRKHGKRGYKCISVKWGFSQLKLPFLIPLFQDFVESLASGSASIGYIRHKEGGTVKYVRVKLRGREALLQAGIATWSWKATEYKRIISVLIEERERERAEEMKRAVGIDMKLVDVAKMLGIEHNALYQRHRYGSLSARLVHVGKGRGFLVVPRDEVERLEHEHKPDNR